MVERITEEPPPFTVLVHGPPGVRLVQCGPAGALCSAQRSWVWHCSGLHCANPKRWCDMSACLHDPAVNPCPCCCLAPQVGKTTLIKGLIKHYTRQVGRHMLWHRSAVTEACWRVRPCYCQGPCCYWC